MGTQGGLGGGLGLAGLEAAVERRCFLMVCASVFLVNIEEVI
jgi:hypothetical protein